MIIIGTSVIIVYSKYNVSLILKYTDTNIKGFRVRMGSAPA